jgi:hypothetical protein
MLDSDTTTWPSLPRTMNSFSQILYGAFRSSKRVLYTLQSLVPICILFLILILRIYIPGTYPEPAFLDKHIFALFFSVYKHMHAWFEYSNWETTVSLIPHAVWVSHLRGEELREDARMVQNT